LTRQTLSLRIYFGNWKLEIFFFFSGEYNLELSCLLIQPDNIKYIHYVILQCSYNNSC
jgi:hypothetical protein